MGWFSRKATSLKYVVAVAKRNYYRALVDNLIAKGERMNTSRSQKIFKTINNMQIAGMLLSVNVYGKPAYAVLGAHVMDLFADLTRSGARHLPGLKGVFEKSPMYVKVEAYKARSKGVAGAFRQAKIQILCWRAERESAYGKVTGITDEFITFAGSLADAIHTPGALNKAQELSRLASSGVVRSHAAVKEFIAEPSFQAGLFMYGRGLAEIMRKEDKSEAEIKEFFSRESTQAAMGVKAVEKAYADKMQGKSKFVSTVNIWLRNLDKQGTLPANTLAFLFRSIFLIRQEGVNVVKQGTDLGSGGVKTLSELVKGGDMTPECADYIARNIGRQGAGAALLLIGAIYYKEFGGVPGAVPYKKDEQGLHPNESTFIPGGSSAFRGAPLAMLQIGATMTRLYNKEFGEKKGFPLAVDVITKPSLNWFVRTFPYTDQDPYKGFYQPHNFFQDIQAGVPGEREKVPKERK